MIINDETKILGEVFKLFLNNIFIDIEDISHKNNRLSKLSPY